MFNFPWSNFHELNLDWILSVVKEAKEIFTKGEGDIQHAVETADQALETAEQAAAGVIADGAVTIPKLNSEVYSLLAYCVSGSVAPNFIPAGALVILRKSTIYNVTDGIYTATRNIPQAAIITAADLDQSATLYREGGMNYLLHNEEKLSGTIDLIKAGLVILVTGDEASAAVPADGLVYVVNNTHGLAEGFYFNSSGAEFPTTGGTADSDSFTAVNNILNALRTAIATLGSDDIANDSTVTGASVTDALDAVKNTLTNLIPILPGSTNNLGYTLKVGDYFESGGVRYKVTTAIPNTEAWAGKATVLSTTVTNDLNIPLRIYSKAINGVTYDLFLYGMIGIFAFNTGSIANNVSNNGVLISLSDFSSELSGKKFISSFQAVYTTDTTNRFNCVSNSANVVTVGALTTGFSPRGCVPVVLY